MRGKAQPDGRPAVFPFSSFIPLPSYFPSSLPFPPLEVIPLNSTRGPGSAIRCSSKSNLEHFSLENNLTSGGNNFNDFAENQLTKCRAVFRRAG